MKRLAGLIIGGLLLLAGHASAQTLADGVGGCVPCAVPQTVSAAGALSTPALTLSGAPIASGGTGTTTFPLVYINSGTAPTTFSTAGTVLGINAPSGFTGNLLDLRVNGAASVLSMSASGILTAASLASGTSVAAGAAGNMTWSGRGFLTSPAAGGVQLGAADAAAPVAQTLSTQSVVTGTSNAAGANLIIQGSRSTGSGASGDVDIAVAPSTAAATTQNTAASAFKVSHFGVVKLSAGFTVSTLPASPPTGSIAYVTDAVACTFLAALTGGSTTFCPVIYTGAAWVGG